MQAPSRGPGLRHCRKRSRLAGREGSLMDVGGEPGTGTAFNDWDLIHVVRRRERVDELDPSRRVAMRAITTSHRFCRGWRARRERTGDVRTVQWQDDRELLVETARHDENTSGEGDILV